MLPDMMLVATGLAMAFKLRGEQRVALTLVRRRLDLARGLPRGDELGGRAAPSGDLRAGEQPVRVLDAARPAVRGRPRPSRGGLRLPGRVGRRQRLRGDVRGHAAGARARAGGRWPDAHRGGDDAHARARRARRHEVRPHRAGRGVAAQGPDRPPGAAPGRARRRRRPRCARRSRPRSRRASRRRWRCRCPTARRRPTGVFADEPALLEDGLAPWSGFATARAGADAGHDLPAGHLRRDARGDARRRARLRHGRGHRGLRRRLQGHRRLLRGVRRRRA